jgi:hypothetical protein
MSSDDDDFDLDLLADMPDIGSDTDDDLLDGLDDEDFGFADDDDLASDEEEAPAPSPAPAAPAPAPMAGKASVNDVLARMRAQREQSRAKLAETLERTAVRARCWPVQLLPVPCKPNPCARACSPRPLLLSRSSRLLRHQQPQPRRQRHTRLSPGQRRRHRRYRKRRTGHPRYRKRHRWRRYNRRQSLRVFRLILVR